MKFSEEQTFQFVVLYRKHECLYNVTHPNYKNKTVRDAALQQMIDEFGMPGLTVDKVKRKIKILRATYTLEVEKIEKLPLYTPKLKWFNEMEYIKKATLRKINDDPAPTPQTEPVDPNTIQQQNNTEPVNKKKKTKAANEKEKTPKVPNKKYKRTNMSKLIGEVRYIKRYIKTQDDNEYEGYGRFVAAQLKQLPIPQATLLQNQINNMITNVKLNQILSSQTQRPSTAHSNYSDTSSLDRMCIDVPEVEVGVPDNPEKNGD